MLWLLTQGSSPPMGRPQGSQCQLGLLRLVPARFVLKASWALGAEGAAMLAGQPKPAIRIPPRAMSCPAPVPLDTTTAQAIQLATVTLMEDASATKAVLQMEAMPGMD